MMGNLHPSITRDGNVLYTDYFTVPVLPWRYGVGVSGERPFYARLNLGIDKKKESHKSKLVYRALRSY